MVSVVLLKQITADNMSIVLAISRQHRRHSALRCHALCADTILPPKLSSQIPEKPWQEERFPHCVAKKGEWQSVFLLELREGACPGSRLVWDIVLSADGGSVPRETSM